jgi:hypothetical protein
MTAIFWITEDADVRCTHRLGKAPQRATQSWVTVAGRAVLVAPDPVGRGINGCPNIGVAIKPCGTTLAIQRGDSPFVRIDGRPVVRADLDGLTDGTPPGAVHYRVVDPAQHLVGERS